MFEDLLYALQPKKCICFCLLLSFLLVYRRLFLPPAIASLDLVLLLPPPLPLFLLPRGPRSLIHVPVFSARPIFQILSGQNRRLPHLFAKETVCLRCFDPFGGQPQTRKQNLLGLNPKLSVFLCHPDQSTVDTIRVFLGTNRLLVGPKRVSNRLTLLAR